jgi:hypothetical protein
MSESTPDKRDVRIAELEAENARLREQLAARDAEIAALRRALAQALERIEELERRLGLDSQNSSKPPSSDGPAQRAKRPKKDKSKRKRGAQKGHEGHHRKLWPPDKVDHFNRCFPSHCSECGLELSREDALGEPIRHQIFEVPPRLIECTEHQLFACQCAGCGHTTRAGLDPGVSRSGWGERLVALVATLSAVCRDSRRQLDWFVGEVLGAPSSLGCVQTHLEEASQALEPGFEQARRAVEQAAYVGLDETGWRLGQLPYWVWVAETDRAACYLVREGRTREVAEELVGEPGERIFATDRYGAYGFLPAGARQICHAHLLREFHQMSQRDGPVGWVGEQLEGLCRHLQREWAKVGEGQRERHDFVAWVKKQVRPRWERLLERARRRGNEAPATVRWLLEDEHLDLAWTFLDHEGLEPTNNGAERALRGPVIQRKLSWGSQSEAGLRLMERLWTTVETCRRQAKSVLDYITEAVASFRGGRPAPILVEC